jgi:glycosyltransferase involved in cell wall biosynthesis
MRIALLSTCSVRVPPRAYGGTELVIAELAKRLTRAGHEVTVFATGDSMPEAELRWHFRRPVWPPNDTVELRHAAHAWRAICEERPAFDVVHAHQAPAVSFSLFCPVPTVLTLHHERIEKLVDYYADFRSVSYVAISHRQAELVPELDIRHVVHHGLDLADYAAGDGSGDWLAFVGRLAPEKGAHTAVDVALAAGVSLRMGGRPHWANEPYFEQEMRPRLERAGERVSWMGEISLAPKLDMLRGARATLFPIEWEEPFGLIMIESILVGTPVIAYARGAAPEVIEEGITGFLVRDARQMVDRVLRARTIDRARCRRRARERFGSERMAGAYERVYQEVIRNRRDERARADGHSAPPTRVESLERERAVSR